MSAKADWHIDEITSDTVTLHCPIEVGHNITVTTCVHIDYDRTDRCLIWWHVSSEDFDKETSDGKISFRSAVELTGWTAGHHADEWDDIQRCRYEDQE